MKVHPSPKKRNITSRYGVAASSTTPKKLRRLPHVFAKVLELPFHSDADVSIQETPHSFLFTASTEDIDPNIQAHTIQIYPGVTKTVIRATDGADLLVDVLELDLWRFRLPASTRPEMASARYSGGELVVTVPKGVDLEDVDDDDDEEEEEEGVWGGEGNSGRLVLVQ